MQNKQRKDEPVAMKHSINFEISASFIYSAYLHSCETITRHSIRINIEQRLIKIY